MATSFKHWVLAFSILLVTGLASACGGDEESKFNVKSDVVVRADYPMAMEFAGKFFYQIVAAQQRLQLHRQPVECAHMFERFFVAPLRERSASPTRLLLLSLGVSQLLLALTYIPLIIFSGGFGGLSGLPHWLNTLMSYLPAQPMIDAVTRALEPSAGQSGPALPGRDLAVLAAWAVGCLLLSVRFFRWDPHRPRRYA